MTSTTDDQPDVFNPACGSRQVLDLIADKWSALILYALPERIRRHAGLLQGLSR